MSASSRPCYPFDAVLSTDSRLVDHECPICMDATATDPKNPMVCVKPCGHLFHQDCFMKSYDMMGLCPQCLTSMSSAFIERWKHASIGDDRRLVIVDRRLVDLLVLFCMRDSDRTREFLAYCGHAQEEPSFLSRHGHGMINVLCVLLGAIVYFMFV